MWQLSNVQKAFDEDSMTFPWNKTWYLDSKSIPGRHCNFSRETGKREICWREISHGKIRREKREIVKSKIRVFWPKLKWKYKKSHLIFFLFFISNVHIYSLCDSSWFYERFFSCALIFQYDLLLLQERFVNKSNFDTINLHHLILSYA